MQRVRDRLWAWGHEAGSHTTAEWGVPEPSRITPVEGAVYLGTPNLILVRYGGRPAPPYEQYAVPLRALREVVWSIVGAGGTSDAADRAAVLGLRATLPNLTGVMMDDFFGDPDRPGPAAALSLAELRELRSALAGPGRPLDLWAVLYEHQLRLPVAEHLALCDRVAFWTARSADLTNLERNLTLVERLAPAAERLLGCYMWDYAARRPLPLELMQMQCELGLHWLRAGRVAGLIFLATCICDLGLEAVEWTRRWIAGVGDQPL